MEWKYGVQRKGGNILTKSRGGLLRKYYGHLDLQQMG
jgi:hypothetical protein